MIPSAEGKRSMMKLAQRMVKSFCCCINPSNGQQWTTISGIDEFEVRATLHKSTDPGQPNGVILSAAATIWLPIPPQDVFNFFRDERTRSQVIINTISTHIYIKTNFLILIVWKIYAVGCSFQPKPCSRGCSHC